jgi:hypothetical protein
MALQRELQLPLRAHAREAEDMSANHDDGLFE